MHLSVSLNQCAERSVLTGWEETYFDASLKKDLLLCESVGGFAPKIFEIEIFSLEIEFLEAVWQVTCA
jgi:hypothetical protein